MSLEDYIDYKLTMNEKSELHILEVLELLKNNKELMEKYYIYGPNGMEDINNPLHYQFVNKLVIVKKGDL